MFNRNQMQAVNAARRYAKQEGVARSRAGGFLPASQYPEVPAGWPNRATRRAIRFGKEHRLSREWRQVLAQQPKLRAAIAVL
jgi:hypothetical protein